MTAMPQPRKPRAPIGSVQSMSVTDQGLARELCTLAHQPAAKLFLENSQFNPQSFMCMERVLIGLCVNPTTMVQHDDYVQARLVDLQYRIRLRDMLQVVYNYWERKDGTEYDDLCDLIHDAQVWLLFRTLGEHNGVKLENETRLPTVGIQIPDAYKTFESINIFNHNTRKN